MMLLLLLMPELTDGLSRRLDRFNDFLQLMFANGSPDVGMMFEGGSNRWCDVVDIERQVRLGYQAWMGSDGRAVMGPGGEVLLRSVR
jgi:hypothetical protein